MRIVFYRCSRGAQSLRASRHAGRAAWPQPVLFCVLSLLAVCGCKSISSIYAPETRIGNRGYIHGGPRVAASVVVLANDFDVLVGEAQSLAAIAENDSQTDKRREAAKRGIVAARRARELKPDRVEGHYWYAVNIGFLADVDRSYGLNAVAEMEPSLKRAGEIDERYDYAGPLRVLGVLLLRTPQPPVSIGSPRKGLRLLQRAVERFPDYPENYLYLGEALREAGRTEETKAAWQKVLALPAPAGRDVEAARWSKESQKYLNALVGGSAR